MSIRRGWRVALPRHGIAVLLLWFGTGAVAEDALSRLPPAWSDRMDALPEADVSGVEPGVQQTLESARREVEQQLLLSAPDTVTLANAYGVLGNLYQLYEVPALAEISYRNALKLEPENFRWAYYAAYLSLVNGRTLEAVERLKYAERIDPSYPALKLRQGQAWYELNDLENSRRILEQAAEVSGMRASALYYLGQIDLLERNYGQAVEKLEEAQRIAPEANRIHYPLAAAYRGTGASEKAMAQLSLHGDRMPEVEDPLILELSSLEKGARSIFIRAMEAVEQRDYESAVALFQEGLERDPGNANARISLARSLYLNGDREQSRRTLERVLDQKPGNALTHFLMGVFKDAAGEAGAQESYEAVLDLDHEHPGANYFLANLLLRAGRFPEAVAHYDIALTSGQENPFARFYRLVALHHAGEQDAVIAAGLQEALAISPDLYPAIYARVRLLSLSTDPGVQDPEKALELADNLARHFPIPPHLEAMTLAIAASGNFQRAIEIQKELLSGARLYGPAQLRDRLQTNLSGFEAGVLPQEPWPMNDWLLTPQYVDVAAVFRDYPSPVPF